MINRLILVLVTLVLLAGMAGFTAQRVGAVPPVPPPLQGILDLLTDTKDEVEDIEAKLDDSTFGLAAIQGEVASIEAKLDRLEVGVAVNEASCASGSVQCGNGTTGHSFAAASNANHNPVLITVLVTLQGSPVSGIASSGFDFSNKVVPAGGGAAVRCPAGGTGCASTSLFQDAGDGTYIFFVHRGPAGNWKAGTYFGRLQVTDGAGNTGSALVTFVIP